MHEGWFACGRPVGVRQGDATRALICTIGVCPSVPTPWPVDVRCEMWDNCEPISPEIRSQSDFAGDPTSHISHPTSRYGRLNTHPPRSRSLGPPGQSHHVNRAVRMSGPTTVPAEMTEHIPNQ